MLAIDTDHLTLIEHGTIAGAALQARLDRNDERDTVPMVRGQTKRIAFYLLALSQTDSASAAEFLFRCIFSRSPSTISDPIAKELNDSFRLREREIIVEMSSPPRVVFPSDGDLFWGYSTIQVDEREIRIEWSSNAKPKSRRPRVAVIVNRFSGHALEILLMLDKADQGPEYAFWSREGRCEIHPRKL